MDDDMREFIEGLDIPENPEPRSFIDFISREKLKEAAHLSDYWSNIGNNGKQVELSAEQIEGLRCWMMYRAVLLGVFKGMEEIAEKCFRLGFAYAKREE